MCINIGMMKHCSSGLQRTQEIKHGARDFLYSNDNGAVPGMYDPHRSCNNPPRSLKKNSMDLPTLFRANARARLIHSPRQSMRLPPPHPGPALISRQCSPLGNLLHRTWQIKTRHHTEQCELNMWKRKRVPC